MSGLQRRNKRSHDADAAEPGAEGQAAVPESAPTPAEAAGGSDAAPAPGDDARTQQLPVTAAEETPAGEAAERAAEVPAEHAEAERARAVPAEPAGETAPGDPELAALVKGSRADEGGQGATNAGAEPTGVAPVATGGAVTGAETGPESGATATGADTGAEGGDAAAERKRRIPRLRRKRRAPLIDEPFPQPLDPNMPAGLEPAELTALPPAGRRGRLRRRLRYLRRARELMLRDLGGLVFEIHRTAGGDVTAHRAVLGAKVQRIANVDREAHAIEDALSAPRGDAVVFQPGIGGTCPVCSELYGSAARFCANCGTPLGATPAVAGPAPAEPAGPAPVRTPAAPPVPAAHAPLGLARAPRTAEPEPEPPTQPLANGRPNPDTTPPELSSGDPLAARERP